MATQDDYDNSAVYNYATPTDVAQQQWSQYQQSQQSGNATTRALANITYGVQGAMGGGPQMQQAKAIQARLQEIMQDVNDKAPADEDPLSKQLRLTSAIATGMLPVAPKMAAMANMQAVKLQQAQEQQKVLGLNTQEAQLKLEAAKTNQQYVVVDTAPDPKDGIPSMKQYGDPISMYDQNENMDPDFHKNWNQAIQDAKDSGAKQPILLPVDQAINGRAAVADTRAKAQIDAANLRLQQAQLKAQAGAGLTEGGLNQLIGDHLLQGPQALVRFDPQTRAAVLNGEAAVGLTPMDGQLAMAEIKKVNAEANAQGRRQGNIDTLAASVPKLGQNVIDALDGVDRTRFPIINQGIIIGKDLTGNPKERQYAAAIQGFVTDYARVIAGAQGVTSDNARAAASDLLRRADSPDAVRSVIKFLSEKELDAIKQAGPEATELLANPANYPHATKIMQHLGLGPLQSYAAGVGTPDNASGQPSLPVRPGQQTGGKQYIVGKTYKDANGNTAVYQADGSWK